MSSTWTVDTGLGSDSIDDRSFVGYKAEEERVRIGSATAFGRTPVLSGTLTIDGSVATTVDSEATAVGDLNLHGVVNQIEIQLFFSRS